MNDNRVDLFYVADRLVNILDANDKDFQRKTFGSLILTNCPYQGKCFRIHLEVK